MLLWVIFAIMTAAALAALLWPVCRRSAPEPGLRDAELAVYRDQLDEIDRDAARGLIPPEEAQSTRNEVARRMLAAAAPSDAEPARSSSGAGRTALVAALVGIPVVALSTYVALGRPDLPGQPRSERLATAVERTDFAAMVAQVEAHLADNPQDAQGWLVLAPTYRGMGRYGDAAQAYARALQIVPATASLLTDFGEMLVLANDGLVTARAREAFKEALTLDPSHAKALFFRGLADRQDGKHAEALATWQGLLDDAPADAPWRPAVEGQLASLERELSPAAPSGTPQLSDEDLADAEMLGVEERQAMVRGMVDRLAQRLEQDGHDLQGWLRLAQARVVLGERAAAIAALRSAEDNFSSDPESLQQIVETRNALGLGGAGDGVSP
jgi:cytochrome c-type biogenesis protein CcmH